MLFNKQLHDSLGTASNLLTSETIPGDLCKIHIQRKMERTLFERHQNNTAMGEEYNVEREEAKSFTLLC